MSEIKKGRDHIFEYRMRKANGKPIWLRDIVTVNKDAEGKPISLSGVFIDIDEGKRNEEALKKAKLEAEQANKIKSEFLATMSHELRTPMNGVLGMAQILEQTELTTQQRENVEIILRSGNSLLAIINDVLDLSKLDADQVILEAHLFNLEQLGSEILDMFKPEIQRKNLRIKMDYPEKCPRYFVGDALRLQQILINMIGNAIKFTSEGVVSLIVFWKALANQQVALTLAVQDTGIGIAAENLTYLFEPFIQADQTTTRKFGGTGLGLSVTKKLIQLMGGNIGVESELGKGSRFWVTLSLPLADEQAMDVVPSSITPLHEKFVGKVLLVEDDRTNQLVAQTILRNIGLDVVIAEDGQQAVELWQSGGYDLILMDCRMPVMDGYEATKTIRAQESEPLMPIIALTANSSPEDRKRCLDVGMNDVLTKPYKRDHLLKCLNQWLVTAPNSMEQEEPSVNSHINPSHDQSDLQQSSVNKVLLDKFRTEMEEDFSEIFDVILQSFETFFIQFGNDLIQVSVNELARCSHNLKSHAFHLGAIKLGNIAAEIEKFADNNEIKQAEIKVHQLRQEYDLVLAELTKVE